MFARTHRLTLRPPWPEDAPALAAAIGHPQVARMLLHVPHPYRAADADAWIASPRPAHGAELLILSHEASTPVLVGGIAVVDGKDGHEFGYWLTPGVWGRGYATEAGRAVVAIARHALPARRLTAWPFADNPASGRVLEKLGFRPTGVTAVKRSVARGGPVPCTGYALDLA